MRGGHTERGFSLVELLVASAIFFTFMVSMLTIYSRSHATYLRGQSRIEVHQGARVALHAMMRELRAAGYDPSGAIPALPVESAVQQAGADRVTFVADVDGNGATDLVTYRIDGDEIIRELSEWDGATFPAPVGGTIAEGVKRLSFSYFDDGAPPVELAQPISSSDISTIRRLSLGVTTEFISVSESDRFSLRSDVTLRNAG